MRFSQVRRLAAGAFVAVILLIGAGAVTTTQAQTRIVVRPRSRVFFVQRPFFHSWYWGAPYPVYYTDPIAYQREQGYSDGLSRGKDDAKHGRANDPNSHSHYRNSSSVTYREAFLQGYSDGFHGEYERGR